MVGAYTADDTDMIDNERNTAMNRTWRTILIVLGALVVAGGLFFAGTLVARTGILGNGRTLPGYGWGSNYAYGPGMMNNGRGNDGTGPGMMYDRGGGAFGPGMMGGRGRYGFGMGPGMMRAYGWNGGATANATPLTIDQAKQAAGKYIQTLNLAGLATADVMIFDNNAYVVVKESSTGIGAFELLVDPASQTAYPEPGPNMMWNLKYSALNHSEMMGGRGSMMGLWNPQNATPADVSPDMPVTTDQATKNAQAYLDQYQSGTTAAPDPVQFYGYYTFDFTRDGKVVGMLSVNGNTGQVFLHTWHGTFVEEGQ
jgi:hypothetical protein